MAPRKNPFQKRSKKRMADILSATVRLLEKNGVEGITTHHIAKQAGISVASLYQYFPNKHAVICALFEQWLEWVHQEFDRIESQYFLKIPWEDFFDRLMKSILANTLYSYRAENQLSRAMRTSVDLVRLDQEHGAVIAERLAGYLTAYGSSWPSKKLVQLGHLLYQMSSLLYDKFGDESVIHRDRLLEWNRTMGHALIATCFIPET